MPGFPLVQISRTGLVSSSTLNEGLGFFSSNRRPQSAVFFGVTTHKNVNFDFYSNRKASALFIHDIEYARYTFSKYKSKLKRYIFKIAGLSQSLQEATVSSIVKKQIEFAFFQMFHERTGEKMYVFPEDDLASHLKKLSKFSLQEETNQAELEKHNRIIKTDVDMAKSFRLPVNIDDPLAYISDEELRRNIQSFMNDNSKSELAKQYVLAKLHFKMGCYALIKYAAVYDSTP